LTVGDLSIVLFDLGGTLIYFDGHWPDVSARAFLRLLSSLQAAGLDLEAQRFITAFRDRMETYYAEREMEFIEFTTAHILRELLADHGQPDVPDAVIEPALAEMYAVSQAHWRPEPDARLTLEHLQGTGYRLGLISNAGDDADVHALVDKAQIRPYFDVILTSAGQGIRKPNPLIFHQALNHWGASPEAAVMVGDTLGADILGARNAGISSIWITRRADTPANRAHAETIQPDADIATLSELPGTLHALDGHRSAS
jgi:HAD superfamily hydrolase (TIGR01549 family)